MRELAFLHLSLVHPSSHMGEEGGEERITSSGGSKRKGGGWWWNWKGSSSGGSASKTGSMIDPSFPGRPTDVNEERGAGNHDRSGLGIGRRMVTFTGGVPLAKAASSDIVVRAERGGRSGEVGLMEARRYGTTPGGFPSARSRLSILLPSTPTPFSSSSGSKKEAPSKRPGHQRRQTMSFIENGTSRMATFSSTSSTSPTTSSSYLSPSRNNRSFSQIDKLNESGVRMAITWLERAASLGDRTAQRYLEHPDGLGPMASRVIQRR